MAKENPNEQFIPRPLPSRILKPMPKPKEGRKLVLILFTSSTILSLIFWGYGNLKTSNGFGKNNSSPKTDVTPILTPTPTLKKTTEATDKIKDLVKNLKGTYGVYVINLTTKQDYGILKDEVFTAASLIKLPVILTLYQEQEAGKIDLASQYTLKNFDKQIGAGSMQYKTAGTVFTYQQMAELMGKQSDNTAFYVIRKILGDQKIQETINQSGMSKTSLEKNETTPSDIGLFFRKLYSGSIVTRTHRDEILGFLTDTVFEDRIPAGVPSGTRVAHKIGNEIGVISDAGIIFAPKPFVIVILSKDVLEKEAKEVLLKITEAVWEFENK